MYTLWFNVILGSNVIFLCFKLIVIHYNTQLQPLVLSYDPFSSWAIQCLSVQKHNWKGMGNAQLWVIQQEFNFVANWSLQVHNSAPFSCNLSQPRALQLKLNLSVLQSVQYEQSSISSWRSRLIELARPKRLTPILFLLRVSTIDSTDRNFIGGGSWIMGPRLFIILGFFFRIIHYSFFNFVWYSFFSIPWT